MTDPAENFTPRLLASTAAAAGSDDDWPDATRVDASALQWGLGVVTAIALAVYAILDFAHGANLALATAALGAATALHSRYFVQGLLAKKLPGQLGTVVGATLSLAALTWVLIR